MVKTGEVRSVLPQRRSLDEAGGAALVVRRVDVNLMARGQQAGTSAKVEEGNTRCKRSPESRDTADKKGLGGEPGMMGAEALDRHHADVD